MFRKKPVTPRKQASQSRSQDTVEVILEAATHILERLGMNQATTNRIAEHAGVSIGSLYQYFPNKEALAGALIDREIRRKAEFVLEKLETLKEEPIEILLHQISAEFTALFLKNRRFLRAIMMWIPSLEKIPVIMRTRKDVIAAMTVELERRKSEITHPSPRHAAWVLVHGTMGLLQMHLYEDEPTLTQSELQAELTRCMRGYLLIGADARGNSPAGS
jgi:AcrR family transcriptional regulator